MRERSLPSDTHDYSIADLRVGKRTGAQLEMRWSSSLRVLNRFRAAWRKDTLSTLPYKRTVYRTNERVG